MKGLVVGTAGHVDHGKTALVRALTGVNTDRWREERERGLTIDIGFARYLRDAELEIGVVDVPGHEDFVKNMLAGATGIDLLLLVVAADEGPMPQTREHLSIASLLGVTTGVVALTKVDRVDPEWLSLAEEAVREQLRRYDSFVDWPLVPVSAATGQGLERLGQVIRAAAARVAYRDPHDVFRMPIDRSFALAGAGTVATGTVWSGRVSRGDSVRLLPTDRTARVRSLQVHGEMRDTVGAGRRCALALVGVDVAELPRGSVAVTGPEWRMVARLGARVELLPGAQRTIREGQRVRVYLGTREVMARIGFCRETDLQPGESAWAILRLDASLVARARDRFILRFYSPVTTIGGGRVAELDPPTRWKTRVDQWGRILSGSPAEACAAAVELGGRAGIGPEELRLRAGYAPATVDAWLSRPTAGVVRSGERLFDSRRADEVRSAAAAELERMHAASRRAATVSLEALRSSLERRFAPELVESALVEAVQRRSIRVDGPRVWLPDHQPALTEREVQQLVSIREAIEGGGIEPPTVGEMIRSVGVERDFLHDALRLLADRGVVVAVSSDLYLSTRNEIDLRARAHRVLEREPLAPPAAFKSEFRVSRKYLIPLLEYLDRVGITRRVGDSRELVTADQST